MLGLPTARRKRPGSLSLQSLDLTARRHKVPVEMLGLPTARRKRPGSLNPQSLDLTARRREIVPETLGLLAFPTQCLLLLDALRLGCPNRLTARRKRPGSLRLQSLDLTARRHKVPVEMLGLLVARRQRPGSLRLQNLDLTARRHKVPVETLGLLAFPTQCLLLLDALRLGCPNRLTARRKRPGSLRLQSLDLTARRHKVPVETLGLPTARRQRPGSLRLQNLDLTARRHKVPV